MHGRNEKETNDNMVRGWMDLWLTPSLSHEVIQSPTANSPLEGRKRARVGRTVTLVDWHSSRVLRVNFDAIFSIFLGQESFFEYLLVTESLTGNWEWAVYRAVSAIDV